MASGFIQWNIIFSIVDLYMCPQQTTPHVYSNGLYLIKLFSSSQNKKKTKTNKHKKNPTKNPTLYTPRSAFLYL